MNLAFPSNPDRIILGKIDTISCIAQQGPERTCRSDPSALENRFLMFVKGKRKVRSYELNNTQLANLRQSYDIDGNTQGEIIYFQQIYK